MNIRALLRSIAFALGGVAACSAAAPADTSGPVILFDDRHSNVEPTVATGNRVIAAVTSHGTLLVPAVQLFEAMGASVSFDRASGTFVATKPGAVISVTAGRHVAMIDGRPRPLDVAPEVRGGRLFVPIRLVAEAMNAYVTWVPDRRIVVIRYAENVVPTAMTTPTAAPEPAGTVAALESPRPISHPAMPQPAKSPYAYARYLIADALLSPSVGNEFSPNLTGQTQYAVRAAIEYKLDLPFGILKSGGPTSHSFIEGLYRRSAYLHPSGDAFPSGTLCNAPGGAAPVAGDPSCVTTIGRTSQVYQDAARLTEEDLEFRSSLLQLAPHAYLATSTLSHRNQFGYPKIDAPFGIGAELLPQPDRTFSLYGSSYYFPEANGVYSPAAGRQIRIRYRIFEYDGGATIAIHASPIFLDLGVRGDHFSNKQNAPGDQAHRAIRAGLGVRL